MTNDKLYRVRVFIGMKTGNDERRYLKSDELIIGQINVN